MQQHCAAGFLLIENGALLISFLILNCIVSSLNFFGNAFLIFALRKTHQTKTVSFKFVLFMSISDLTTGLVGISLVNVVILIGFHSSCLLLAIMSAFLSLSNSFSLLMIVLIAFDRYLHMTYLERYQSHMNNRRGYLMTLCCFFGAVIYMLAITLLLLFYHKEGYFLMSIMQECFVIPVFASTFILYLKGYKNLKARFQSIDGHQSSSLVTNQLAKRALADSKRFWKIAKMVTLSSSLLSFPLFISGLLNTANKYIQFADKTILYSIISHSSLIYAANAFSSSVIFITQNTLIRNWIRGYVQGNRINDSASV